MSEAKSSKKASKAKTESAPKAESKSESKGADTKPKDDAGSASSESASTEAKSSDGAKESGKDSGKDSAKDAGKSARDSAGGKADVHYGYFSSVRTPEYRSGWDAIWGSENGDDAGNGEETPRQRRAARTSRPAKARKRREPITVTLDLDTLPPELKDGLVEIASAELRKSRVSYARRDKAGAIDWRITCRVD